MRSDAARILIVDDESTNIDVLVGLLQGQYRTLVAKSGEQALRRAHATPRPDLILLDIMMPGLDGYEVCQRLKGDPETAGIPVIFITGKSSTEDETHGLEVGAVDFIRKPFNPLVALARIQTHLALQRQKSHLLELNATKNKLLGIAAHDLRNPLNSITGLSELLLQMEFDEEERRYFIQTIHNVAGQMLGLINDLLDVSVIESGTFALRLAAGDMAELVAERVHLLTFTAEKKGVRLVADLQPTPATSFDRARIAQVVDNLLSNAIKFTPLHSVVLVRTGQQRQGIFVQVVDQGPGIPEAEQHKLFGVFEKLSTQPTGQEKSTGLGLSIVKKIVDAHRGEIQVQNNLDRGAMFTCWLPRSGSESAEVIPG
ncbi:MAG: hybrid sensor histidine kinase/response regulator [Magnetococcales bacterium]|nr:hybrid sensor histidine kinase/response regulator [Magnetococcales bacterium]